MPRCLPQGSWEVSASRRGWKMYKGVSLAARFTSQASGLVARPLQLSPLGLVAQALHQHLLLPPLGLAARPIQPLHLGLATREMCTRTNSPLPLHEGLLGSFWGWRVLTLEGPLFLGQLRVQRRPLWCGQLSRSYVAVRRRDHGKHECRDLTLLSPFFLLLIVLSHLLGVTDQNHNNGRKESFYPPSAWSRLYIHRSTVRNVEFYSHLFSFCFSQGLRSHNLHQGAHKQK